MASTSASQTTVLSNSAVTVTPRARVDRHEPLDDVAQGIGQVDALRGESNGTAVASGKLKHVLDQEAQAARLLIDDLERALPLVGTAVAAEQQGLANNRIWVSGVRSSWETRETKSARIWVNARSRRSWAMAANSSPTVIASRAARTGSLERGKPSDDESRCGFGVD